MQNHAQIQLPIGAESDLKSIIDIIQRKTYHFSGDYGRNITTSEVPEDMVDQVEEYRTKLLEYLADYDEDFMMQVLEGEEPSIDEIKRVLRIAVCAGDFFPVLCGSAYKNKGVQLVLDAVVDYLPAPTDVPSIKGTTLDGEDAVRHSSDEEPFSALAFKIMTDPFVGKAFILPCVLRYSYSRKLCIELFKGKRTFRSYRADAC